MDVLKEIKLTKDKFALVDEEDFKWLSKYKWSYAVNKIYKNGKEYGVAVTGIWNTKRKNNDMIKMHRLITNCPKNKQVDHINGNQLDNRKNNLRIVNGSQNNMNRKNAKGYCWDKKTSKWKVEIGYYGKKIWIGRYDKENNADMAYQQAKLQYYGRF